MHTKELKCRRYVCVYVPYYMRNRRINNFLLVRFMDFIYRQWQSLNVSIMYVRVCAFFFLLFSRSFLFGPFVFIIHCLAAGADVIVVAAGADVVHRPTYFLHSHTNTLYVYVAFVIDNNFWNTGAWP